MLAEGGNYLLDAAGMAVALRITVEIEDTYLQEVMDRYGLRTKTEAVELALRHLAVQSMTREDALAMRGAHAIDEPPRIRDRGEPRDPRGHLRLGRIRPGHGCSQSDRPYLDPRNLTAERSYVPAPAQIDTPHCSLTPRRAGR
jgi:Arc/MetJ family transcription regulator